ncbi:MAG: VPLPA-CTERM sorting domain-containing protein [Pseudomonadales bacterium]|nr:VPLPA-CTERM sorting domain-containing protein [Halioglobus sp.]MCP5129661.1 VPLPA-CTERM sorting domain-containing protein [Pseudomonadales bacterium]
MFRFARLIIVAASLGVASSTSASMAHHIDFYFGSEITGDPIQWAEIVFPQAAGCVSGEGSFGGQFDCSTSPFGPATNTADEISITGSLGDGTLNAGVWAINADTGLLDTFYIGFSIGDIPVGIGGAPDSPFGTLYPNEENPIGVAGTWRAIYDFGDGEGPVDTGGVLLVTPSSVPLPAAAWLFGSALLGLGAVKRRKA